MRDIDNSVTLRLHQGNNGYGEFEDDGDYKVKFEISSFEARFAMVNDRNFSYDHYCLNNGTATVGGGKLGNKLYFSVSFCAPNDNFSRKTGRIYVADNFISDDRSHRRMVLDISSVKDEPPTVVLMYALAEYLKRGKCVPQWAKNSAVSFRKARS